MQDDVIPQADHLQQDAQQDVGPLMGATVAVYDSTFANTALQAYGHGIVAQITIHDDYAEKPPTLEESVGVTGCKVWEYVDTDPGYPDFYGIDQGTVQLTFTNGPTAAPPCVYGGATQGYICPWGMGVGGTWSTGPAAGLTILTLTNAGTAISDLAVGSLLVISDPPGGGTAVVKGPFPIMAVPAANTLVLYTATAVIPNGTAETGAWVALWGYSPSPATVTPGFSAPNVIMADNASVQAVFTPGTGADLAAFDLTVTNVGDEVTMAASAAGTPPTKALTEIPFDGSAFKVECSACGQGMGSILRIVATNGDLTGVNLPLMPDGTKRVEILCSQFGQTSLTVPADYSAKLTDMTRAQATFMRLSVMQSADPKVNFVGGHAVAGFTDAP